MQPFTPLFLFLLFTKVKGSNVKLKLGAKLLQVHTYIQVTTKATALVQG